MKMLKVIIKGSFLLIFFLTISCKKENNILCKDDFLNVIQKINYKYDKIKDVDYKITKYDSNTSIIVYKTEIYCLKYVNNKFVCLYILNKDLLPTYCIRNNENYLTLYKIIYNKNNVEIMESTKNVNKIMLNLKFCDFLIKYKTTIKTTEFDTNVLTLPDLFLKHPLWMEINL